MNNNFSRKSFIKKLGAASAGFIGLPLLTQSSSKINSEFLPGIIDQKNYSANDQIQIGLIGAGMMGQNNVNNALQINGTKLVAVCDLYDSRLERSKELWGKDISTTRDYREILANSDVDSVIVATTDHWHRQIAIDALKAGKSVYCEKPMVHKIEQGFDMIDAEKETGGLLQIGSQSTSAIVNAKARELFREGAIGDLNFVETYWDRQSFSGAWNYSIPPSAGPHNIDWDTYLKDLPEIPFDAEKFFRWRKYRDFGTGVAGDLFVHMFSALHFITDSKGPERIYGTGGLRFWDDGRDVPDVMLGVFDYPETENHPAFNLSLRVNFADGSGGGYFMRMVGTDGEFLFKGDSLILRRSPMSEVPDMSINNFDEDVREEYQDYHNEKYPDTGPHIIEPEELVYKTSPGLSRLALHHRTLFNAIREGGEIVQNGAFGLRAAAPALAANKSYFDHKPILWDPEKMKLLS